MKLFKFAQDINKKYKSNIGIFSKIGVFFKTKNIAENEENFKNKLKDFEKQFNCLIIPIIYNDCISIRPLVGISRISIKIAGLDINYINELITLLEKTFNLFYKINGNIIYKHDPFCSCIICNNEEKNTYVLILSIDNKNDFLIKNFSNFKTKLKELFDNESKTTNGKWFDNSNIYNYIIYLNLTNEEYQVINDLTLLLFDKNLDPMTKENRFFRDIK